MEAMEMKEIEAAVEGILFASGEPVAADRIAVALDLDRDTVDQVLRRLAELLGPMGEFGRSILTRDPEPMERGKVYEYDQQPADLVIAMQEVTDRRGQAETPPLRAFDEIVRREPYSVEQKAKEIVRRLKEGGITRFLLLFRGSRSRSELVATFMAVLELCRSRIIRLAGPAADCTVTCREDPENTEE